MVRPRAGSRDGVERDRGVSVSRTSATTPLYPFFAVQTAQCALYPVAAKEILQRRDVLLLDSSEMAITSGCSVSTSAVSNALRSSAFFPLRGH